MIRTDMAKSVADRIQVRLYNVQCTRTLSTLRCTLYTVSVLCTLQYTVCTLSVKLKTEYRNVTQYWKPGFMNGVSQFSRYIYFSLCFLIY